jgi:amidase
MAGATLNDLIAFDNANAAIEMPYFGQELFELAASLETGADTPQPIFGGLTYNQALQIDQDAGGANGIDKAVAMFNLTAIATPTGTAAWTTDVINGDHFEFATSGLAAIVGYPIVQVPMGQMFGLPIGISFIGPAFSEPALIKVAAGFEAVTHARIVPQLFRTLPLDNVAGVPLAGRKRHGANKQLSASGRWRPHSM